MAARVFAAPIVFLLALAPPPASSRASALFSSHDVLTLKLEAPLNELFARRQSPDNDLSVTGTLTITQGGRETPIEGVHISLRGHTSQRRGECGFPKLKLKIPAEAASGTSVLAGHRVLKIGTHCGESAGDAITARYGRLANERAPIREAFVYRLLDVLGVPTLKARPARVTYIYTDPLASATPDQHRPIVRNAVLVEDDDEAVARLGGTRQITEAEFTNAHRQFSSADTALIAFAEAMTGNFDWCLKMTPDDAYRCDARHPLWNVLAIVGADGRARPLIYDFDVAGMVAGRHHWFADVYNEAFVSSGSHLVLEVLGQVQRTRTLLGRRELDEARAHFMQKKSDAYRTLESAGVDPSGKQLIREYLDAFFDAIGSDDAFYRPAVVIRGTLPYANASRTNAVCAAAGPIPIGTVVSDPLDATDRMMRVVLLDTRWHWATPTPCDAIHQSPVWVDKHAVSMDYPRAAVTH